MYSNSYNMFYPFYDFYNYDRGSKEKLESGEVITLKDAISLIKKSVEDEKEDEVFYNSIIAQAPTEKEKNIIRSIRDDEIKHNQILRNLYYEFTGERLPLSQQVQQTSTNMDYKANLERALFGELDAVSKYRKILGAMPSGNAYTLLMAIMTDEIRHAIKYNFLIQNSR